MGTGTTWAREYHEHGINTGTGPTWTQEHGHGINMGTGTWARDQHGHGNTGMGDQDGHRNMGMGSTGSPGFNHAAIIRLPGVRGRSPWKVGDPVPTQAWEHGHRIQPCSNY